MIEEIKNRDYSKKHKEMNKIIGESMKEHILLEKAYIYENIPQKLTPEGCYYDRTCGVWRIEQTDEIMMIGNYAKKPASKKCDIETGEDQKGE